MLKPYLTLYRIYLSLFAACSAATGFFLAPAHRINEVPVIALAVFLLACGASALNQYQERDTDARMGRTRQRPLPSGAITPAQALFLSLAPIMGGLILCAYAGGAKAFLLGLLALLWYNGIYTRLKKATAFASVPGAVVGMIPPALGWVTGGGELFDRRLAAICFLFFMWQVPHFWLLLLNHGEEYERAGLPSLTRMMSRSQIARVTFVWIVASTIASLALPLYGATRSPLISLSFIPPAGWLIWSERSLAGERPLQSPAPLFFRKINIYFFLIMLLISFDRLFLPGP